MSFKVDRARGHKAESRIIDWLESLGFQAQSSNDLSYDITAWWFGYEFRVEVKHDEYAHKSGNVAIEFANTTQNKPSGINKTDADIWVHIVGNDIHVCSVSELLVFIRDNQPCRVVTGAGDGNADLMLYEKHRITPPMVNFTGLNEAQSRTVLTNILYSTFSGYNNMQVCYKIVLLSVDLRSGLRYVVVDDKLQLPSDNWHYPPNWHTMLGQCISLDPGWVQPSLHDIGHHTWEGKAFPYEQLDLLYGSLIPFDTKLKAPYTWEPITQEAMKVASKVWSTIQ